MSGNLKECCGYTGTECPWYANYHIKKKYLCAHHTNVKYGFNVCRDIRFKCGQCKSVASHCIKHLFFKSYYCQSCLKSNYRYNAIYIRKNPDKKQIIK